MDQPAVTEGTQRHEVDKTPLPDTVGLIGKLYETREILTKAVNDLAKRVDELDAKRKESAWKFKFLAGVISVVVPLAGFLGFHYTYKDVVQTLEDRIHEDLRKGVISEDRAFYNDLMFGAALNTSGRYRAAIARLSQCLTEAHTHDPAVLVPLLDSIYRIDDWESAVNVLATLRRADPQLQGITDATVLAYIGAIQVQGSISHPEWLEPGFAVLQRAHSAVLPGDAETLGTVFVNYWIYDLQRHDMTDAKAKINALKEQRFWVFSWHTVSQWRFFRDYFQNKENKELEPEIAAMWNNLSSHFIDSTDVQLPRNR